MDFGITNKMSGYLANIYQKSKTVGATDGTDFLSAISGKMTEKAESADFETTLKGRYPAAYYNVMDTAKINNQLWGRNDYPWNKYFCEPADEAVLDWAPSGNEPSMQDPKVQANISATLGKLSVVIPPALENEMKNNPEVSESIMKKIDDFVEKYYRPGANQGFLITFNEDGEIGNACITSEGKITVSSSEFIEQRKAREARHEEYERLAEENAVKRKLREQEEQTIASFAVHTPL